MASSDFKFEYITITLQDREIKMKVLNVAGKRWYKGKHIATVIGYKNTNKAILDMVDTQHKCTLSDRIQNNFTDCNEKSSIYINENGLRQLLVKSRMPYSIEVAKQFNINVETKYTQKETEVVAHIQQYLTSLNIPHEFQKALGLYKIDLYLPTQRIAIEVDENGHKDRCLIYEKEREAYLKIVLRCKILRFNPDAHNFHLATCLAEITKLLYNAWTDSIIWMIIINSVWILLKII